MVSSRLSFGLLRQYSLRQSSAKLGHLLSIIKSMLSYRILRGADSCRYGDLSKEFPTELLMQEVDDGLRRINRGTTANGNDDVRARLLERLYASANSRNRGVFPNIVKRGCIAILLTQDAFHFPDDIRLYGMRKERDKVMTRPAHLIVKTFPGHNERLGSSEAIQQFGKGC